MSEVSPCLNCGACCSHFRVSFFWGECSSSGGTVPDELVTQITPSRVAMNGTDCKSPRCTALVGEVGSNVQCSIYEQRSSPCREFEASWENGEQNVDCDAARARFGLPPLDPEWNQIHYDQSA
ncbi:YkgJ family cysteine cluster protein [Pseudomonas sp. MG-9]|uniref:YkgJ family cysteine cluster protein n=1 Tax=Pseudomonas serboccidentalis TaxID=2964670 RepID=A0ABY7ZAH2_9PSED|nr:MULTISPECIES: YkgJ family cysteine cluster protein [Pseudomonas]MBT9266122.1 YkgJ family cysteine cluster protein [Pseudomonas sp. MG-9]WDR36679.1 YkgJ family cysteine cluster protein [Pseudomonas serboccidentalis]